MGSPARVSASCANCVNEARRHHARSPTPCSHPAPASRAFPARFVKTTSDRHRPKTGRIIGLVIGVYGLLWMIGLLASLRVHPTSWTSPACGVRRLAALVGRTTAPGEWRRRDVRCHRRCPVSVCRLGADGRRPEWARSCGVELDVARFNPSGAAISPHGAGNAARDGRAQSTTAPAPASPVPRCGTGGMRFPSVALDLPSRRPARVGRLLFPLVRGMRHAAVALTQVPQVPVRRGGGEWGVAGQRWTVRCHRAANGRRVVARVAGNAVRGRIVQLPAASGP